MPNPESVLQVEVADRVATLTLNRPDRRNALNAPLRRRLREAIGETEANPDVDVVILTGADPAFCAGLDLTEFSSANSGLRDAPLAEGRDRGPLGPHAKPVIGAVNGVAVTGGLELALACDFIIASEQARFADTHTRVGVLPGWGLTVLLPEAVGLRRAREMSATGNYVDAQLALLWGLVNRVVPHGELLATCRTLAAAVVSNDQPAVRTLLETYGRTTATTADEGWQIEAEVHRAWTTANLDAATTSRLKAVIDRGRTQVADHAKP
ncbi:MAG TPA: enoyl-CoA hydratase [Acidimicrobiales bacterium]|jgi:enoyl-CoA hydratase|nr:enoyl-CoA hydratase [Acidimicrobiales bacterium]